MRVFFLKASLIVSFASIVSACTGVSGHVDVPRRFMPYLDEHSPPGIRLHVSMYRKEHYRDPESDRTLGYRIFIDGDEVVDWSVSEPMVNRRLVTFLPLPHGVHSITIKDNGGGKVLHESNFSLERNEIINFDVVVHLVRFPVKNGLKSYYSYQGLYRFQVPESRVVW